jgi:hypothetical protein
MKKSFDKHQKTWIISGTIIIVVLLAILTIFQLNPSQTISVTGQSELEVVPDLLVTYFNIEATAGTASEAQAESSAVYDSFISSLSQEGIEESEVKTSSFSVTKNYEWVNGRQVDNGYIARHSLKIELPTEEKDKIGDVIDAAIESDVLVSYVSFELSDDLENDKKAEATMLATEDARTRAEAIAEGLNGRLGSIVSVSDSSVNYYPMPLYAREDSVVSSEAAGEAATDAVSGINPSEQSIYASVHVVYKIR